MANILKITVPTEFIQNHIYCDLTMAANYLIVCPSDDGFVLEYETTFMKIFNAYMKNKYQEEYKIIGQPVFDSIDRTITCEVDLD